MGQPPVAVVSFVMLLTISVKTGTLLCCCFARVHDPKQEIARLRAADSAGVCCTVGERSDEISHQR